MAGAIVFKGQLWRCIAIGARRELSTAQACTRPRKILLTTLGVLGGGVGTLLYTLERSHVEAGGAADQVHSHHQPWPHDGVIASLDHASIRRGYEVYKQVCKACHSLEDIAFRNLVGVSHTEEEAKAEAQEVMIKDGPDETGEFFERPGRLSDYFPKPYPNEQAARYANNGSFPPDLSLIAVAREGGEDYIYALLTGYTEPPAGVTLREGQNYNPYFAGGALAMGQVLSDDCMEYTDGTCPTAAQMAKDVATFLTWAADPTFDDRKEMTIRICLWFSLGTLLMWYLKKVQWASMKSRKVAYKPVKKC